MAFTTPPPYGQPSPSLPELVSSCSILSPIIAKGSGAVLLNSVPLSPSSHIFTIKSMKSFPDSPKQIVLFQDVDYNNEKYLSRVDDVEPLLFNFNAVQSLLTLFIKSGLWSH